MSESMQRLLLKGFITDPSVASIRVIDAVLEGEEDDLEVISFPEVQLLDAEGNVISAWELFMGGGGPRPLEEVAAEMIAERDEMIAEHAEAQGAQ